MIHEDSSELLPILGEFSLCQTRPRAMPWAMSSLTFLAELLLQGN